MTTDSFCFYFQNRLIQTSQTGGQLYSDTPPFSIPCTISFMVDLHVSPISHWARNVFSKVPSLYAKSASEIGREIEYNLMRSSTEYPRISKFPG
jgi:hypothetical protein